MLTPAEARVRRTTGNDEAVRAAIRSVDGILSHPNASFPVALGSAIFPTSAVREEIKARYTAAGWKVRLVLGPRDGDYLEFSEG